MHRMLHNYMILNKELIAMIWRSMNKYGYKLYGSSMTCSSEHRKSYCPQHTQVTLILHLITPATFCSHLDSDIWRVKVPLLANLGNIFPHILSDQ